MMSVPSNNSAYMLLVRPGDGQETVERWSISPLEKKNEFVFPHAGNKPNSYVLSARGEFLIALVSFPRTQIEVYNCDKKLPKTVVDMTYHPAGVSMALQGITDLAHFAVRVDNNSQTGLEIRTNGTGQPSRNLQLEYPVFADFNAIAFSPNGRLIAALNRTNHNIDIYSDRQTTDRTIPTTNAAFEFVDLAVSDKNDQVGMYAIIAGIPTVMSFRVANGEPIATGILPRGAAMAKGRAELPAAAPALPAPGRGAPARGSAPRAAPAGGAAAPDAPFGRSLLWYQGPPSQPNPTWIVNGNDLIDATTGMHYGSFGFEVPVTAQLAAGNTIIFFNKPDPAAATGEISIAKLDDAKIKAENK